MDRTATAANNGAMIASPATLLSAAVTVLVVLFYWLAGFSVARMRGKHAIRAPATSGHPEFDRAFRVHMNTLEQMPVILPLLWLATLFFHAIGWLPAALGLVWIVGRIVYRMAYMTDPGARAAGFVITNIANVALLVLSVIGIVNSWMAVTAV
jgi:glutathione S-transferase